jgi:hypothetical protein
MIEPLASKLFYKHLAPRLEWSQGNIEACNQDKAGAKTGLEQPR